MAKPPFGMILSAGLGTRLLPLTRFRQKTTMELGSYPIIYYLLKMFEKSGIKDVAINLHHLPDQVKEAVQGLNLDLEIHFLLEEEILGTAGAIKNAIKKLEISKQKMVIMHGDIVCDIDILNHLNGDDFCTLICATDQTIDGYVGSVHVDENGLVTELGRFFAGPGPKARAGFFAGIHILSEEAVRRVSDSAHRCLVSELYPRWLEEGLPITGSMQNMYFADIGSPARLLAANMKFLAQRFHTFVGKGVSLSPTAKIVGPVLIADDAFIGPRAVIGPQVIVGKRAVVGEGARIRKSMVMSQTVIEKDETLDCVIALSHARVEVKS